MRNFLLKPVLMCVFSVSLVVAVASYYFLETHECGNSIFCFQYVGNMYGLIYGFSALTIVFALLLIFPHSIQAWKKFALWFLPLAFLTFLTYDRPLDSGFMDVTPHPIEVYKFFAVLYVALSVLIISVSELRRRLGKQSGSQPTTKRTHVIFWATWSVYIVILLILSFYPFE